MPKKYSDFDLEMIFEDIFRDWPNEIGEASARKAFFVAVKQGENPEHIQRACHAYSLDNIGADPSFLKHLGNFIREDFWKDILENVSIEKLERRKKDALILIEAWNNACKPHWLKSLGDESKLGLAVKALANKDFALNWRSALFQAQKIFAYKIRQGDKRSGIVLSFRWFTNVGIHHTVMGLIEGQFGHPEIDPTPRILKRVPINYDARHEMAAYMKELFPDINYSSDEKETPQPPEPTEPTTVTDEARRIAESIRSGIHPVQPQENNVEAIVQEVTEHLKSEAEPISGEDDSFTLT